MGGRTIATRSQSLLSPLHRAVKEAIGISDARIIHEDIKLAIGKIPDERYTSRYRIVVGNIHLDESCDQVTIGLAPQTRSRLLSSLDAPPRDYHRDTCHKKLPAYLEAYAFVCARDYSSHYVR